jgi:nitrite reductase (NADH) large subunit
MVVCSCRRVSDRDVSAAIVEGATTVEAIAGRCAAGSRCGGCWPELERLIDRMIPEAHVAIGAAAAASS